MSEIDRSISNTDVIPVFRTDLFEVSPEAKDARFALGLIAVDNEVAPGREEEYQAYLKLRANVYADQTKMLDKEEVRADGTESDKDDGRSYHFGLYEQNAEGYARSLGSIRLIVKNREHPENLPIEDFFGISVDFGVNEASRLISRHENSRIQEMNKLELFAAAIACIRNHNLGDSYATVEPAIETLFNRGGMPNRRVAEPVYVPKYKADNLGLVIDTAAYAEKLEECMPGKLDKYSANEGQMVYYGRMPKPAAPPAEVIPLTIPITESVPVAA